MSKAQQPQYAKKRHITNNLAFDKTDLAGDFDDGRLGFCC
jgi:hypothetical protein